MHRSRFLRRSGRDLRRDAIVLTLGEADEAPVIGETIIEIGAVKPDRARLRFLDPNDGWRASKTADGFVNINGRTERPECHLYVSAATKNKGAAHDLKAEVIVKIAPAATPVTWLLCQLCIWPLQRQDRAKSRRVSFMPTPMLPAI